MHQREDGVEDFKRSLAVVRLIHIGIGAGPAMFLFVIYFLAQQGRTSEPSITVPELAYISAGIMVINSVLAHVLFRMQMRKISWPEGQAITENTAREQIPVFLSAHILRLALIEGAALFACVILFRSVQTTGALNVKDPMIHLPLAALAAFFLFWALWFPSPASVLVALQSKK